MPILKAPIELTKARKKIVWFDIAQDGQPIDITDMEFVCDVKYKATDSSAIFTLRSDDDTIIKHDTITNRAGLVFTEDATDLVNVPAGSQLAFPFVTTVGELCYIDDNGDKRELFKFIAHVHVGVTTSV